MNKKIDFRNLVGSRIKLVSINKMSLEILHSWSTDPIFYKYLEFNHFNNINQTELYLKKLLKRSNGMDGYYWAISLLDNKIIGNYGIMNIDNEKKMAELGYGIHPKYWGFGYFKEATKLIIDELFQNLKFNRLWAKTHIENKGSINGLISCGFVKEGVLRDYYYHKTNKIYSNAVILGILKKDYRNITT